MSHWIFGYGSLIWNPNFSYREQRVAFLPGWARRFWQGSTDHRGVPEKPGLVVTLIAPGLPQGDASQGTSGCWGMAYLVDDSHYREITAALDHREKGGYSRQEIELQSAQGPIHCLTYIALPGNPDWVGEQPIAVAAAQIANAVGPSGENRDYLERLDAALEALGHPDPHVKALMAALPPAHK